MAFFLIYSKFLLGNMFSYRLSAEYFEMANFIYIDAFTKLDFFD